MRNEFCTANEGGVCRQQPTLFSCCALIISLFATHLRPFMISFPNFFKGEFILRRAFSVKAKQSVCRPLQNYKPSSRHEPCAGNKLNNVYANNLRVCNNIYLVSIRNSSHIVSVENSGFVFPTYHHCCPDKDDNKFSLKK